MSADGPQTTITYENVVWDAGEWIPGDKKRGKERRMEGWKDGDEGKARSVEGRFSRKMCHPRQHEREGPTSEAQWEGSRSDFFWRISPLPTVKLSTPPHEVPADGPQTTITYENVVWGAGRWTPDDGMRQGRDH